MSKEAADAFLDADKFLDGPADNSLEKSADAFLAADAFLDAPAKKKGAARRFLDDNVEAARSLFVTDPRTQLGAAIRGTGAALKAPAVLLGNITGSRYQDEPFYKLGADVMKFGERFVQPEDTARETGAHQRIEAADGFLEGVGTAVGEYVSDPALIGMGVSENMPQLLVSIFGGKLGSKIGERVAARRGAAAAAKAGERAGYATAITTGATFQGADVGDDTYTDIMNVPEEVIAEAPAYRRLVEMGMSPEEARHQLAIEGGRQAGALSAGISLATARAFPGLEKSIFKGGPKGGPWKRGAKAGTAELFQEGTEEGGGRLVENLAVQAADPRREAMSGVGGAAGQGGVLGFITGGAGGVNSPSRDAPPERGYGQGEYIPDPVVPPENPPTVGSTVGLYPGDKQAPMNVVVDGYSADGSMVTFRQPDGSSMSMRADQFAAMAGQAVDGAPTARTVEEAPPSVTEGPPVTDYDLEELGGETEVAPPGAQPKKPSAQRAMNVPDMDEPKRLRRQAAILMEAADEADMRRGKGVPGMKTVEQTVEMRREGMRLQTEADLLEGQRKARQAVPNEEGSEGAKRTAAAADAARLGQLGRNAREPGAPEPVLPPIYKVSPDPMGNLGRNAPARAGEPAPVDEGRGRMGALGRTAADSPQGEPPAGDFHQRGQMGALGLAKSDGRDPGGGVYTPPQPKQPDLAPGVTLTPEQRFNRLLNNREARLNDMPALARQIGVDEAKAKEMLDRELASPKSRVRAIQGSVKKVRDPKTKQVIEVRQSKLAGRIQYKPPPVKRGPMSLLEALARAGGMRPDGNFRSEDADNWHKGKPFMPALVREGGMSLEDAADWAGDNGYMPEAQARRATEETGGNYHIDPKDFLEVVENELRGNPRFAIEDQAEVEQARGAEEEARWLEDEQVRREDLGEEGRAREDITKALRDLGEGVDENAPLVELQQQLDERLAIMGVSSVEEGLASHRQAEQAYIDAWTTDPRYGKDPHANIDDWINYAEEAAVAERGGREGDQAAELAAQESAKPEPSAEPEEGADGRRADAGEDQQVAPEDAGQGVEAEDADNVGKALPEGHPSYDGLSPSEAGRIYPARIAGEDWELHRGQYFPTQSLEMQWGARRVSDGPRAEFNYKGDTRQMAVETIAFDERRKREADLAAARERDAEKVAALKTEKTGQGEQGVLLAQDKPAVQAQKARDAKGGLTGKGPQLAADEGLFGQKPKPDPAQTDLEDATDNAAVNEITKRADDDGFTLSAGFNPLPAFKLMYRGLQLGAQTLNRSLRSTTALTNVFKNMRTKADRFDPLSLANLGWIGRFVTQPASLASKDRRFAAYFNQLLGRTYMKERLERQGAEAVQRYFSELTASERDVANKIFEYDRIMGIDRKPVGKADIVIKVPTKPVPVGMPASPRIFPLELSKPGETIHANARVTKAVFEAKGFFADRLNQYAEAMARNVGYNGPFLKNKNGRMVIDEPAIKAEIAKINNPASRKIAERALQIAQDAEDMGRQGYFPLMRHGDWYIKVIPKDHVRGKPGVKPHKTEGRFELVPSMTPFESITKGAVNRAGGNAQPTTVRDRIEELKKRYDPKDYDFEWDRVKPNTLAEADIPALEQLFTSLSFSDPKLGGQLYSEVLSKVFEAQRAGHRKQAENVPGYSVDFSRALADYVRATSSGIADMRYARDIDAAVADIEKNSDDTVKTYTSRHREYIEAPSNRIVSAGLRAGFFQFLWGSPATAAIQLTQTPVITGTQLDGIMGAGRGQAVANRALIETLSHIRVDGKGLTLDIDKIGRTPAERAMLRSLKDDGVLEKGVAQDLQGDTFIRSRKLQKFAAPLKRMFDIGASMYNVTDTSNRVAAALAYFRAAQDPKVRDKAMKVYARDNMFRESVGDRAYSITPEAMARFGAQETQFVGGRLNQAPIQRGYAGWLTQFATYPMNYMRIMGKNLTKMGPEGKAVFSGMMLMMLLFSGLKGWPYAEDMLDVSEGIYKKATGVDPMLEWRFREMIGDEGWRWYAAEAAMGGFSRQLTGWDLGRRLGVGNIVPDVRSWAEAFPVMSATVGRLVDMGAREGTGQPDTMWANASQAFLGKGGSDLVRGAHVLGTEGSVTKRGDVAVQPGDVSGWEKVSKSMGFNPTDFARNTEESIQTQRMITATKEKRSKALTEIAANFSRAENHRSKGKIKLAEEMDRRAYAAIDRIADEGIDETLPEWQMIPMPQKDAINARIASYEDRRGAAIKKAPKMVRGTLAENPFVKK